ncbi:MAG: hypothetical protein A4E52_00778 [Pelotomaculum sp. PtaB.Bin013]|uniref:YedE-related selenium metabolism membrane protein n=1 Tax=Pelotomaculum isophthalicicum JI TaxID=947010 RepID=A0A9X4H430_9FIRM|nr:YedE family putative selenium transporter [Pelotomaculum isophthalicicum]MDF9407322.1 YedE-related selenium metabolism membrane protein [Pelotomaculum isophthalicicum JI]OPX90626.1 MAG: hypothetical protein A4E52_00778 [Pelotomaculum sp. PtaB.Bin013]
MNNKVSIIITGAIVGALAILLVKLGNPQNMGICIACFLRDITGALGLQQVNTVQYIRPEILGLVIGAFATSVISKDFRVWGGSSTFTRFILGFFVMFGMLVFLGCPLRMILRMSAGDLNALVGLLGLVAGVSLGTVFLRKGFTLGQAVIQNKSNGYMFPAVILILLILLLAAPAFIYFSQQGPGSMHAPLAISLGAGIIIGVLAQRTRLCLIGGIRDLILFKELYMLYGFIAIFVVALVGNILMGNFHLGLAGQPIAHNDGLWNFLGMALGGFGCVLLGGCPLRQLIAASEGNTDSAVTITGLLLGAAFAHNFGLAAGTKGVPVPGQVAVVIGLIVVGAIAFFNVYFNIKTQKSSRREVPFNDGNKGCEGSSLS